MNMRMFCVVRRSRVMQTHQKQQQTRRRGMPPNVAGANQQRRRYRHSGSFKRPVGHAVVARGARDVRGYTFIPRRGGSRRAETRLEILRRRAYTVYRLRTASTIIPASISPARGRAHDATTTGSGDDRSRSTERRAFARARMHIRYIQYVYTTVKRARSSLSVVSFFPDDI